MKWLITILLLCSFFSQDTQGQGFKLVSATSQGWTAGIKDGGSGINYKFSLVAGQVSTKLKIDQLWIGNKYYAVEASKKYPAKTKDGFLKNDTLYIKVYEFFPSKPVSQNDSTPVSLPLPFKFDGDALFGYTVLKKRKYFIVKKIEVLPHLAYP